MRGLTILVVTADAERLHAAFTFAAAAAAGGASARVHLHETAVRLLAGPLTAANDEARGRAGLPTLAQIFDEAGALGVRISVCQSGLALAGLTLEGIDPRIEASGPLGLFGSLGTDQFISF